MKPKSGNPEPVSFRAASCWSDVLSFADTCSAADCAEDLKLMPHTAAVIAAAVREYDAIRRRLWLLRSEIIICLSSMKYLADSGDRASVGRLRHESFQSERFRGGRRRRPLADGIV